MPLEFPLGAHVFIVGTPGGGKTALMYLLYDRVLPEETLCIWYDLEEDYDNISKASDETVFDVDSILDAIQRGAMRIHFEEESPHKETQFKNWNMLLQLGYDLKECYIFNDEVMQVCELWGISDWHRAVLSRGRKRRVSLIEATQRTQNVHKDLVALSHVRVAFWVDTYDQKALAPWYPELAWLDDQPDYYWIYKYRRITKLCKPVPYVIPRGE